MDVNELHHGQKLYSQQNILLPRSIVWETCYVNLCWWLEEYKTESKFLVFPPGN